MTLVLKRQAYIGQHINTSIGPVMAHTGLPLCRCCRSIANLSQHRADAFMFTGDIMRNEIISNETLRQEKIFFTSCLKFHKNETKIPLF